MNRSFRLIWNVVLGLWVVASEAAKGKTKSKTISNTSVSIKEKRVPKIAMTLLTASSVVISAPTWADTLKSVDGKTVWEDVATWDKNTTPADADDVIVKGQSDSESAVVVSADEKASSLILGSDPTAGYLNISSDKTLTVSGSTELKNGKIDVSGTLDTGSMTVSGDLTLKNGGSLKATSETLSLVNGGTLNIGGSQNESATSAGVLYVNTIDTNTKAKISFNHTNHVNHSDYFFYSKITGSGSVDIKSGTTVLIINTYDSNYSGRTTLTGGVLKADSVNAFSNRSDFVVDGGTLDLNDRNQSLKSIAREPLY